MQWCSLNGVTWVRVGLNGNLIVGSRPELLDTPDGGHLSQALFPLASGVSLKVPKFMRVIMVVL